MLKKLVIYRTKSLFKTTINWNIFNFTEGQGFNGSDLNEYYKT